MLRNLGFGVAGAAVFAAAQPEARAAGTPSSSAVRGIFPVFDVTTYGAVGDGVTDDSGAIQNAINDAQYAGGVVWFPPPPYAYLLANGLTISDQCTLAGAGWPVTGPGGNGSWLLVNSTSVTAITIPAGVTGVVIRDLAIAHDQPAPGTGWAPSAYPPAIQISATDCFLYNLYLRNPTYGISVTNPSGSVGRIVMEQIWGQPLLEGITIDNGEDVIKVDNIHFWPFWSNASSVSSYMVNHAIAIHSYQNANPHFTRLFAFGYNKGMVFDANSSGYVTSKFRVSNADFDSCLYGLQVNGAGTTGMIDNFTMQGPAGGGVVGIGLTSTSNGSVVQATNVHISVVGTNGIRVNGSGSVFIVENVWIADWNISRSGFPGIETDSGATSYVGFGRFFQTSNGAANTGGSGTTNLD